MKGSTGKKSQSFYAKTQVKTGLGVRLSTDQYENQLQKQYLQKLRTQRIKAEHFIKEYSRLQQESKYAQEKQQQLRKQILRLKQQGQARQEHTAIEISRLQMVIDEWQQQHKVLADQNIILVKSLTSFQQKNTQLIREKQQLAKNIQVLSQDLSQQRNKNDQLTHQQVQLKAQIQGLRQDFERQFRQLQQNNTANDHRLRHMNEQNQQHTYTLHHRTKQIISLKQQHHTEIANRDQIIARLTQQLQLINPKVDEIKQTHSHRQELQGRQVEHTRREIKEIEIVLKKEQNKHSLLQTKFKDIASERSQLQQEVQRLQSVVRILEKQYERIAKELKTQRQTCLAKDAIIVELREQLLCLRQQVADYEAQFERRRLLELQRKELIQDQWSELDKFQDLLMDAK